MVRLAFVLVLAAGAPTEIPPSGSTAGNSESAQELAALLRSAREQLDEADLSCDALNVIWDQLTAHTADDPYYESVVHRLRERRRQAKCLRPCASGAACSPVVPQRTSLALYRRLHDRVDELRQSCAGGTACPLLDVREVELARLAIVALRDLLPGTHDALTIETELAVDICGGAGGGPELRRIVATVVRRCSGDGSTRPAACAELVSLLSDRVKAEALVRVLEQWPARYPGLPEKSREALRSILTKSPAFSSTLAAIKFLELVDEIMDSETIVIPSPSPSAASRILVVATPGDVELCAREADHEFGRSFARHLNSAPMTVVREPVPLASDQMPRVRDMIPQLLTVGPPAAHSPSGPEAPDAADSDDREYREVCAAAPTLCQFRYPSVVLLQLEHDGTRGSTRAEIEWWVRTSGSPPDVRRGSPRLQSYGSCDLVAANTAGVVAAHEALHEMQPPPPPPPPENKDGTAPAVSAWLALAFSGAPYLASREARSWSKIVPSVMDVGLVAGTVVATGLAIDFRNDFSRGEQSSLAPANNALVVAASCAGGLLLARLASALIYAWLPAFWRDSP